MVAGGGADVNRQLGKILRTGSARVAWCYLLGERWAGSRASMPSRRASLVASFGKPFLAKCFRSAAAWRFFPSMVLKTIWALGSPCHGGRGRFTGWKARATENAHRFTGGPPVTRQARDFSRKMLRTIDAAGIVAYGPNAEQRVKPARW